MTARLAAVATVAVISCRTIRFVFMAFNRLIKSAPVKLMNETAAVTSSEREKKVLASNHMHTIASRYKMLHAPKSSTASYGTE